MLLAFMLPLGLDLPASPIGGHPAPHVRARAAAISARRADICSAAPRH